MAPLPLLHVGYHKTATTWLQRRLFTPGHGFRKIATHAEIFDGVCRPHGLAFDPGPFADLVAGRIAALEPGLVPVVSSEILSGHPFYGGRESDLYARRLHAALPQARILLSIRAQPRILPSVYMQYLFRGGRLSPEAFFAGESEPGYFGFDPVHFEYDRLVALYQELYGTRNVHVLTQESLAADMDAAAAALAAFAGNAAFPGLAADARHVQSASPPESAVATLRRLNLWRRSVLNPVPPAGRGVLAERAYRAAARLHRGALKSARRPVTELVRARFADRFADSNRRLAGIVEHPLDLSAYPGGQDGT